jgi:outer membrane protein assembly factor BamD
VDSKLASNHRVYCRAGATGHCKESLVRLQIMARTGHLVLVGLLAMALATGCRSHREKDEAKATPEILYKRAHDSMRNQSFEQAIKQFDALESRFPFSEPARQARLDIIYAYYRNRATDQAVDAADTFIRENPASPRADYAYYMKGMVYFERQANFVERYFKADLTERPPSDAHKSFDAFDALIKRYPHSEYSADARLRMVYLRNRLASYEFHVADYYIRRGAYIAALNRARFCVENYDGAPAVQGALAIMVKAYKALKMDDLAANAEQVYKDNYPADIGRIERKRHWWNPFS